jgi:glycine oxidase
LIRAPALRSLARAALLLDDKIAAMSSSSDIIVVGAGIVGCAVACELSQRGARVRILDDRQPGMGATQASAGMLNPYLEARDGRPLLELAVCSLSLYDTFVARAATMSGHRVMYRRSGTLEIVREQSGIPDLQSAADLLRARGVAAEVLDAAAVRREEPQVAGAAGGLLIDVHGYVAAAELTTALATAARRQSAELVDQGRARRISRRGDQLRVDTAGGTLDAPHVIVAAGCWAGQIEIDGLPPTPVRPVRGQLVQLQWDGPPLRRVVWGEHCYVVPWEDGTVLVGATVEDVGFDERTTAEGVHDLIAAACDLLPHARTARFVAARAGLRPCTPDELPIIGPSGTVPNLTFACGHYRNGVLLAPITAQLVADVVLGDVRSPLLDLTTPHRFGL